MVFVAAQAPHLQAQGSAGPPLLLFSTSDVADLAAAPAEVHAQFNHIRGRRETAAVRAVSIANFAAAVHAATIRLELDGRTIIVDRDVQERTDEGKDSKEFWEGTSVNGDELGLLFWQGRLSGRLLTQDKYYKIQRLKGSLFALIEIKQLDTSLGCDTPEGGRGEATVQRGAYAPGSLLESVGVSKSSSTQQYTRVLVVYTDAALDAFVVLENLTDGVAWAFWDIDKAFDETDAYTRPKHVGTEWISFDEPASWDSSSVIWEGELPDFDDEIFELREQYTADIVMLILEDETSVPCCRGSARTADVTDINDAIIYVDVPYVDSPRYYSTVHEVGHMFGAYHTDGYRIKSAVNSSDVRKVCFDDPPHNTLQRDTETLMRNVSGSYEGRVRYFSSYETPRVTDTVGELLRCTKSALFEQV